MKAYKITNLTTGEVKKASTKKEVCKITGFNKDTIRINKHKLKTGVILPLRNVGDRDRFEIIEVEI